MQPLAVFAKNVPDIDDADHTILIDGGEIALEADIGSIVIHRCDREAGGPGAIAKTQRQGLQFVGRCADNRKEANGFGACNGGGGPVLPAGLHLVPAALLARVSSLQGGAVTAAGVDDAGAVATVCDTSTGCCACALMPAACAPKVLGARPCPGVASKLVCEVAVMFAEGGARD